MDKKILKRDFIISNLAGGLGVAVMLARILLQHAGKIPNPPCIFFYYTHMYCPGCGGTRALFSLFKGHIIKSICYNPAVVFGAILILYYEVTFLMTIVGKKDKVYYTKSMKPIILYVIMVLVFTVVRNILLVGFGIDLIEQVGVM